MDGFPAGLRVLVVDDDPTWIKILEKMLKKCSYEVTTCCKATDALNMLRERKDRFDIVISDVYMPDMDGFKLLEQVGLEMDLPVIMMSVDGETSRVMKGVQHGACDYLLKPIRMKELRNIWQHVYRKKINEVKEIESQDHESNEGTQITRRGLNDFEYDLLLCGSDLNSTKKRKELGNEEHGDQDFSNNASALKKARVVWSVDLHQKFVNAVNHIGFDKVGPKKILDLMNIPGLTRENVASHLQKYRLYLSRLQRQSESNTAFCGIKQSDFSSKDHPGKFGLQSSTITQHNSPNSFGYSSKISIVQDAVPEIPEDELKNMVSFLPITDAKNSIKDDVPVAQKFNTVPQQGVVLPFGGMVSDDCTSFESTRSQQQSWSEESPVVQLMHHLKQDHELHLPLKGCPHPPLHGQQHHFQVDPVQTAASANSRTGSSQKAGHSEINPLYAENENNHVRISSPIACGIDTFPSQLEQNIVNQQRFGEIPVSSATSSTKNQDLDRNCTNNWEYSQSLTSKSRSSSISSEDNLPLISLQSYGSFEDVPLDNVDLFYLSDSSTITDLQSYVYDGLRFDYDDQCDSMEYPITEDMF
ncbi:two-component response regulator ORR26-like protein [Cinnamomum micranthum f. kanehirae]|uniref:Two-component response regulator n=1 Tax=Cinnamomum micranthum f. kanehirae TaxID=337451 RepID=A0A3S3QFK2_9MAGN|nr:two-component response regulator ORR26-like protein [Cinnamomum micranthum f. kanehirae]